MKKFWLRCATVVAVVAGLVGCERAPELVHLTGETMGTYYSIKYIATDATPSQDVVQAAIDQRLETVNDQMSTYRTDSELSQFNQHQANSPVSVSPATITVINEAIRLSQFTQGALDVTVGPLVNLWSFGPEKRPETIPSDEEIASRMAMTGLEHLSVDGRRLTKTNPDLYVDLSTIAKGYGVDVVANYLGDLGLDNYLVEIGGELQLKGVNQDQVLGVSRLRNRVRERSQYKRSSSQAIWRLPHLATIATTLKVMVCVIRTLSILRQDVRSIITWSQ